MLGHLWKIFSLKRWVRGVVNKTDKHKFGKNKLDLSKIKVITKHEIFSNIKRKQFVIMTVIVPIIFMILVLFSAYFSTYITNQKIGYVDEYGMTIPNKVVKYNPIQQKNVTLVFKKYNNISKGKNDVINGKINVLIIIPKDYLSNGTIIAYSKSKSINPIITESLKDIFLANILKGKVNNKIYNRVKSPLYLETYSISKEGVEKENIFSQIIPIGFIILLYLAITSVSGLSINSIIEEKQHRIMEILLSFTNAKNIVIGKIFGIFVLGLIQMSLWLLFALPLIVIYSLHISFYMIISASIFFVLAYLFYISLLCGLASLFTTPKDAGQLISPILMIQMIPMIMISFVFTNPNNWIVKILSYIPFTAPQIMLMRMSITHVNYLDVFSSIVVMAIFSILTFALSIKLFKIGSLIYDESLTLKHIFKIIKNNIDIKK